MKFRAYLDESKSPEGIFVVAGFVLHAEGWSAFEDKWARALERWNVGEFHANRFERRVDEYATWREPYRRQFHNHLVCTLADTEALQVGVAVPLKDYRELDRADREVLGSPGTLCAFRCFELVADWFERKNRPELVAYVVDEGGGYQGELAAAHAAAVQRGDRQRLHLQSLMFGNSRELLPLQAADWAAYEGAKQVRVHLEMKRSDGSVWKPRWGLESVVQRLVAKLGEEVAKDLLISDVLDAEQLTKLAPIRRREQNEMGQSNRTDR